ncbi:MAG: hypothetical protein ACKOFZ_08960 [Ilumatobacteraceae bacterium]
MALALQQHPTHPRSTRSRGSHLRLVIPGESAVAPSRRAVSKSTYFRRRLAVGLMLVALVGGGIAATRAQANGEVDTPVEQRYVIAQDGDNLWAIAERIAPTGNIPEIVDQLASLNGTSLRVGQVVLIP